MKGSIKKKVAERGFGFIRGEDGKEYFFHKDDCYEDFDSMPESFTVSFEPDKTPKGLRARNVVPG